MVEFNSSLTSNVNKKYRDKISAINEVVDKKDFKQASLLSRELAQAADIDQDYRLLVAALIMLADCGVETKEFPKSMLEYSAARAYVARFNINDDNYSKLILDKMQDLQSTFLGKKVTNFNHDMVAYYQASIKVSQLTKSFLDLAEPDRPPVQELLREITKTRIDMIKSIICDVIKILGEPGFEFEVVGLGSMSRYEMIETSDFEWAILINDHNENTFEYINLLTRLVHYRLIAMGDTAFYLNKVSVTKHRFSLDTNSMNPMSFNLFEIEQRKEKLFNTPERLVNAYNYVGAYDSVDDLIDLAMNHSLTKLVLVYSHCPEEKSGSLIYRYNKQLLKNYKSNSHVSELNNLPEHAVRGIKLLSGHLKALNTSRLNGLADLDVKDYLLRPIQFVLDDISIHLGIVASSSWDILIELEKRKVINSDTSNKVKGALSKIFTLRIKLSEFYGTEYDRVFYSDSNDPRMFWHIDAENIYVLTQDEFTELAEVLSIINQLHVQSYIFISSKSHYLRNINFTEKNIEIDKTLSRAMLLMKFQQYEQAIEEFDSYLKIKNIQERSFFEKMFSLGEIHAREYARAIFWLIYCYAHQSTDARITAEDQQAVKKALKTTMPNFIDALIAEKANPDEYKKYYLLLPRLGREVFQNSLTNRIKKNQNQDYMKKISLTLLKFPERDGFSLNKLIELEKWQNYLKKLMKSNNASKPIKGQTVWAESLTLHDCRGYSKKALSHEVVEQLITESGEFNGTTPDTAKHKIKLLEVDGVRYYIKYLPLNFAMTKFVDLIHQTFIGHGVCHSDIIRVSFEGNKYNGHNCQPFFISISEAIHNNGALPTIDQNLTQKNSLERIYGENQAEYNERLLEVLLNLDPNSVSELILIAILINPGDGRWSNYCYINTDDNGYQLISCDHDINLQPSKTKDLFGNYLGIFSLLFCLDNMKNSLSAKTRNYILGLGKNGLSFNEAMRTIFLSLIDYNQKIEDIFPEAERDKWKNLKFSSKEGFLERFVTKFLSIQKYICDNQDTALIDILCHVEPEAGYYFRRELNAVDTQGEPNSVFKRYNTIIALKTKGKDIAKATVMQNVTRTVTTDIRQWRNKKDVSPEVSLSLFEEIQYQRKKLINAQAKVAKGNFEPFKYLLVDNFKEAIISGNKQLKIEPISFVDILLAEPALQALESVSFATLKIINSKKLTSTDLSRILLGSRNLQKLVIDGSEQVDDRIFSILAERCPYLNSLVLRNCKKITTLSIAEKTFIRRAIDRLANDNQVFLSCLTELEITDCEEFETIALPLLELKSLTITGKCKVNPSILYSIKDSVKLNKLVISISETSELHDNSDLNFPVLSEVKVFGYFNTALEILNAPITALEISSPLVTGAERQLKMDIEKLASLKTFVIKNSQQDELILTSKPGNKNPLRLILEKCHFSNMMLSSIAFDSIKINECPNILMPAEAIQSLILTYIYNNKFDKPLTLFNVISMLNSQYQMFVNDGAKIFEVKKIIIKIINYIDVNMGKVGDGCNDKFDLLLRCIFLVNDYDYFNDIKDPLVRIGVIQPRENSWARPLFENISELRAKRVIYWLLDNDLISLDLAKADDQGNLLIHKICTVGDETLLKMVISKGASLDVKNELGQTCAHHAATGNHVTCLKQLLAKYSYWYNGDKIDDLKKVFCNDVYNNNPLYYALINNSAESASLLIGLPSDNDAINSSGTTVMHLLIDKNKFGMFKRNLDANARKIDSILNGNGESLLQYSLLKMKWSFVGYLINASNVRTSDSKRKNLFHTLAEINLTDAGPSDLENFEKFFTYLAGNQTLLEDTTQDGTRPIALAIQHNNIQFIKKLTKNGWLVPHQPLDDEKTTSLHLAVREDKLDCLKLLLEVNGIDFLAKDAYGLTALSLTIKMNKPKLFSEFIFDKRCIAIINKFLDNSSNNLLHLVYQKIIEPAIDNTHDWINLWSLLVKSGVDILRPNINAVSPLLLAIKDESDLFFNSILLQYGERTYTHVYSSGETLLHKALRNPEHDMNHKLKLYLDRRQNPKIKDLNGKTALHIAVSNQYIRVCAFILAADDGSLEIKDDDGRTALHLAVLTDNEDLIEFFLRHNADINVRDNLGQTPLHLAVSRKKLNIIKSLLESHAKPNIVDKRNKTAWNYASEIPSLHTLFVASHPELAKASIFSRLYQHSATLISMAQELPTHAAARKGDADCLKKLLNTPGSLDKTDSMGRTCLHIAAIGNQVECAKVIIEFFKTSELTTKMYDYFDIFDRDQNTAKHLAAISNNKKYNDYYSVYNVIYLEYKNASKFNRDTNGQSLHDKLGRSPLDISVGKRVANNPNYFKFNEDTPSEQLILNLDSTAELTFKKYKL